MKGHDAIFCLGSDVFAIHLKRHSKRSFVFTGSEREELALNVHLDLTAARSRHVGNEEKLVVIFVDIEMRGPFVRLPLVA